MFTTKSLADAGNAAIVACNQSNAAEQQALDLRAAAVAAIKLYNDALVAFLSLRDRALESITANESTSHDLAAEHSGETLPRPIPDPDGPATVTEVATIKAGGI